MGGAGGGVGVCCAGRRLGPGLVAGGGGGCLRADGGHEKREQSEVGNFFHRGQKFVPLLKQVTFLSAASGRARARANEGASSLDWYV